VKILLFLFSFSIYSFELKPFETDGCTFIIDKPIFSKKKSFKYCCFLHDISYWIGGSRDQRSRSDKELRRCIKNESNGFYGTIFYFGVRTGHLSPIKSRFKWGWGRSDDNFSVPTSFVLDKADEQFNRADVKNYLKTIYSKK